MSTSLDYNNELANSEPEEPTNSINDNDVVDENDIVDQLLYLFCRRELISPMVSGAPSIMMTIGFTNSI